MKVCTITATKGRHTCIERCVGFFMAQDHQDKVMLIYNNSPIPQKLSPELIAEGNILLINNHLDLETGSTYTNLGAIYRDALKYVPEDVTILNFMDDDDAYLPNHISEGVKGFLTATQQSQGDVAYRPDKFYSRYLHNWTIDQGMYAEPAIFVSAKYVREKGFHMVSGSQHHGWLAPILENKLIFQNPKGTPTLIIDWSQEIPTWKTSGDASNPQNFINYDNFSQDHGDGTIEATPPHKYYTEVANNYNTTIKYIYNYIAYIQEPPIIFSTTKPEIMHAEVDQWLISAKEQYPEHFENCKVLEVGSLDINGTIRKYFNECDYLGLDLGDGPGVDLTSPVHEFVVPNYYDTVVSTEMLEHDQFWMKSLKAMYDNLKPGGLLVLTCAGPARHAHGTTEDTPHDSPYTNGYYRNRTIEDIESILPKELFHDYTVELVRDNNDLRFIGVKRDPNRKESLVYSKEDFYIVTAQPDTRQFCWEVDVQLTNFRKFNLSKHAIVCVYWESYDIKPSVSHDWIKLKSKYPEATFKFIREDETILSRDTIANTYTSSLRPYVLSKLWKLMPELEKAAVLYMDADVIFCKNPDISAMLKGTECYGTEVGHYLNTDYLRVMAGKVGIYQDTYVDQAAAIVGITKEQLLATDKGCGGAQYVLKGITSAFWDKVLNDSIRIKSAFAGLNQLHFQGLGALRSDKSVENAGVQSWCADMWAILYNLSYFGLTMKTPKFMDSVWSSDELEDKNKGHMAILHNAGVNSNYQLFNKVNFRPGNPLWDTWPMVDLSTIDNSYYGYYYAEALVEAGYGIKAV